MDHRWRAAVIMPHPPRLVSAPAPELCSRDSAYWWDALGGSAAAPPPPRAHPPPVLRHMKIPPHHSPKNRLSSRGEGSGGGETPLPSPTPHENMTGRRWYRDVRNRFTGAMTAMVFRYNPFPCILRRAYPQYINSPRAFYYTSAQGICILRNSHNEGIPWDRENLQQES